MPPEHVVKHNGDPVAAAHWIGTEQRRYYRFKDDKLILRTPPLLIGGKRITGELVWERIRIGNQ